MIQFNLLPDIKQQYIKAERLKRLIIFISAVTTAATLAIFVLLLLYVDGVQKKSMSDLTRDIKDKTAQLKKVPDLDKILTVQNQLNSLSALHTLKPQASRIFGYIGDLTPASISISKLNVDYNLNTMVIAGNTDSLDTVNTYIDTLKFTTFTTSGTTQTAGNAFKGVTLTSFTRNPKNASYSISTGFDPRIFSDAADTTLNVPTKITTRSTVDQPTALFQKQGN